MEITAIVPGKKSRSAIYIDGEYAVSLENETIFEERVHAGDELDDDRLYELIQKSDLRRAKEKALSLISYRDYTRHDLIDRIKKTVSESAAEAAADRMEELGLINDEKYAARYAEELLIYKKLSKRGALYKMLQKGLDRDICEAALDQIETDPIEQITALIEKKYAKQLFDEKGRRRAFAALQRMGYSYADIREAAENFTEDWIGSDEL